ncbi:unnamed protein product [Lactuca virosa]|uniref:NLE domain-containing protein n=1 Tax=Lactuca virosa TaxID=75947 RepID=A0AAU9NPP7_9ASTR|nr:unnamed protein product [Lactuca virosa]
MLFNVETYKLIRFLSSLFSRLADPEGTPLGASVYLPQSVGPKELQQMVNKLLNNEEKLSYTFCISDQELLTQLGDYLQKKKVSMEKVITVVYQPQAVVHIRLVNRFSSTIVGPREMDNWYILEPVYLRSPSHRFVTSTKNGDARIWDATLRKIVIILSGHTLVVTCVKSGGDGVIYTGYLKIIQSKYGKPLKEN